jgi:two-component system, chemotaxis family, protein-glutamate methylesterase/glutaminase
VSRRDRIRVLVIDDSAFSRQTIIRMLETSALVEVVGYARDGEEALRKALGTHVDLITLDLEMPRMDGFTFLRLLMAKKPTPVIVISGRSGDQDVFKALELGAVDFVAKPTPRAAPELATIEQELIRKVHAIRELRMDKVRKRLSGTPALTRGVPARHRLPRVVAIGSSTGGPAALMQLFSAFSEPPPLAFVVAQHMPAGFTRGFAERLDRLTTLRAREAEAGAAILPGTILIAPGGSHLEFESRDREVLTRLVPRSPEDKYAPSVDRLFVSAAKHFGADLLAVVLTGMGDDGRRGVRSVKEAGGNVIVESEETAVVYGMPQQAIRAGAVDAVLTLPGIAAAIQVGIADAEEPRTRGWG